MDVDRTELDDVLSEEVDGHDPEEAAVATEEWLERVPPGDEPVEPEAETDGGPGS
jgi:hypothetical protein